MVFPAFFLVVVLGIQFALWSHASHLARAAAEQGSQVASSFGSSPAAGTSAAYQFIAATGAGTLTHPSVNVTTLTGDVESVTVTGRAQVLIPWLSLNVAATSVSPSQRFRRSG